MALVECGLCGWTQEIDEELPDEKVDWIAKREYSQHMLDVHTDIARSDPIVREYVSTVAAIMAPTNGIVLKKGSHD